MKTRRILQVTTLVLAAALLVAGLINIVPARTQAQRPSFAAYTPEMTLLENRRDALARKLYAQARFLAETEREILTELDTREALVATRLACLTDQLTYAEARTIDLRSRLQAIKQTRDGNDDYGLSMRLWNNAVAAAESAEQALRDKLDEEKAAAASLHRKRAAFRLLYDEFDSTEQLYAALCRRIQKLQHRPDAPPSS